MTSGEKIARISRRIAKLVAEREAIIKAEAAKSGWTPCDDCASGYCTMNCSSTPPSMQVLV